MFDSALNYCATYAYLGELSGTCVIRRIRATVPTLGTNCPAVSCYTTVAWDAAGNPLSAIPANAQSCFAASANFAYEYTPISLEWDGPVDFNKDTRLVQFRLNPHKAPESIVWRASGAAPLLVWDPEHKGVITSGAQLIGSWSFGGKENQQEWKSGYEVLEHLDRDKNGTLVAKELEPLGLWFDSNQDAISQPGEVFSLTEKGVTQLFTKPDETNPSPDTIRASHGFVRKEGSRFKIGAMTDWLGASAKDAQTLQQKFIMSNEPVHSKADAQALADLVASNAPINKDAPVDGVWFFKTNVTNEKDAQKAPQGFLAFSEHTDGTLGGYTFGMLDFSDGSLPGVGELLKTYSIKGQADGKNSYQFELVEGRTTISNKVQYDSGTDHLIGETKTRIEIENQQPLQLSYTWVAERYKPK